MAEVNTDVSEGTVDDAAPSVTDSAPDAAESTTQTETTEAQAPEVDLWEKPFEFPAEEEVKTDAVSADAKKEGDEIPAPESGEQAKADKAEEATEDDEPELSAADIDPSKPTKLSRRKREQAIAEIIEPFRDPNTPPEDVFNRLYALDPDRAASLANKVAETSISTYPDEWLSQILGEQVTVADVKAKLSTPTQAKAESDSFSAVESALNETYGDAWKDASRDDELLSEDLSLAQALRAHRSNESAKDTELAALREQLEALKPEIQSVKDAQTNEIQIDQENLYKTAVGEYRSELEKKSLGKIFTDTGLAPSESDTPEMKELKNFITTRFDFEKSGDFDLFTYTEFSDREKAKTIIQRVDKHFKDAAEAEAKAKRAKGSEAEQLRAKAQALREKAQAEKPALTVLHRNAAQEFLEKAMKPVMAVMQQNAEYRRQLSQTRPELLNGSAAPSGDSWKERLQKADDPWESKEGWDTLAAGR